MRPLFLSRAASRTRRGLLRALVLVGLPLGLLLIAGMAHAQFNARSPISENGAPQAVNELPVEPAEVGDLFRRWERTERRRFGKDLLPAVAELTVRARIRGITNVESLPLLMVVAADVTHHVAGARNCAAGADSYARLLQTGKERLLAGNDKVREVVERLGHDYASCKEAREDIAHVAGSGLAGVFVTGMVDGARSAELAAERERRAVADLTVKRQISEPPASPVSGLHRVEDTVTGWVVTLGGDSMAQALASAPWLDPDSPEFKRGLWWAVLAMTLLGGQAAYRAVTNVVTVSLRQTASRGAAQHGSRGTTAPRSADTARKPSVVRRR